jgi:hypothetical protein
MPGDELQDTNMRMKLIIMSMIPLFVLLSLAEITFRSLYVRDNLMYHLQGDGQLRHLQSSDLQTTRLIPRNSPAKGKMERIMSHIESTDRASDRVIRIAVIGGSSAAGTPYDTRLAFPNMLRLMIQAEYPEVDVYVYNLSVFAGTYRSGLRAARDAMLLSPDALIVYSGHNEGYAYNLFHTVKQLHRPLYAKCINSLSSWLEQHSMTVSWILDLKDRHMEKVSMVPPEFEPRDHVDDMLRHYEGVTDQLSELALENGFRLIFGTLIRNIRDYPPSGYDGKLDDTFSPLPEEEYARMRPDQKANTNNIYRLARWYSNRGDRRRAHALYNQVSDLTHKVGRVHTRLQTYIRELPSRYSHVECVDVERDIQRKYGTRNLGNEAIIDWVHPRAETSFHIAQSFSRAVRPILEERFVANGLPLSGLDQVLKKASSLSTSLLADGLVEGGFVNLQLYRPDVAEALFDDGLRKGPAQNMRVKALFGMGLIALRKGDTPGLATVLGQLMQPDSQRFVMNALASYRTFRGSGEFQALLSRLQAYTKRTSDPLSSPSQRDILDYLDQVCNSRDNSCTCARQISACAS